ncbi:MAG: alpha/beta hydrolase [Daejeonella sp.]|uniref:alpha/beta hydrolase n=1 Tax=Daejeonella sp. TaxID=2805397 RepID=UPI003C768605
MRRLFILFVLLLPVINFAFAADIEIKRDISYSLDSTSGDENLLDVYYPDDVSEARDVFVFIHGGSWNSGKKGTYWWLGRNMANKNVVTVIINYSLSPVAQYEKMAADCAKALKWVDNNIATYGGNNKRIFVMGHSAGAHLAALIHSDPRFFNQEKISDPIKGLILNDAFGLDMFEYLSEAKEDGNTKSFLNTFSTDQEVWKLASPLYYLKNFKVPVLIFVGERTYPAIQLQSERLRKELSELEHKVILQIIPKKKHIPMIAQMFFKGNGLYDEVIGFMGDVD